MDSSWNQVGSGEGFAYYTPCMPIFGEHNQETEGSLPTPQVENGAAQVEAAEVEVVAPQAAVSGPSRRVSNGKNIPRREKKFSMKEDELLCSAYINVSKDSIAGCNQPMGAYWDRVFQYYHGHKTMQTDRSKSSLIHRWEKIQRDTSKFCGFYDKIERLNESGKNEDDRVKDALQMFQDLVSYSFPYYHCWLILRRERKWCDSLASLSVKDKQNNVSSGGIPVSGEEATPNLAQTSIEERPMGRDRDKKLKRAASESASSTACLEVLQKMSNDRSAFEERQEEFSKELADRADRKLAAQERLAAVQEFEQEQRIMSMDIDKVLPSHRAYYLALQQKIMQKHIGGSGPASM